MRLRHAFTVLTSVGRSSEDLLEVQAKYNLRTRALGFYGSFILFLGHEPAHLHNLHRKVTQGHRYERSDRTRLFLVASCS